MTEPVSASSVPAPATVPLGEETFQLEAERMRLLYRGSRIPALLMLIAAAACVGLLWGRQTPASLVSWWFWISALAVLRLHQGWVLHRSPAERQAAPLWRRQFLWVNVPSALALAYATVWLVPPDDFLHQVLVYGLIGSVVLAASIAYAVSLPAFFSFAVPCLLPAGLALAASELPLQRGWGVLALILLATLSVMALQINRLFSDSLEQRRQNAQLIARLEQARRDAEALNHDLAREIEQRGRAEQELRQAYDGLEQRVAERTAELRQSEARLNLALEASDLGLWDWNLEEGEVHHSRLGIVFGIGRSDRCKGLLRPEVHPDDAGPVHQALVDHLKGRTEVYAVQYRARSEAGPWVWIEDRGQAIEWTAGGRVRRMIGTRRDITASREQAEQQQLAATVFEASGEGIVILDASFHVLAVNEACCALSGYRREELLGQRASRLYDSEAARRQYPAMRAALETQGSWQSEQVETRRNGESYPQWLQLRAVRDNDGRIGHIVAFIADLTVRQQVEARLRYLTEHDELTGLANRTLLRERLNQACQRARAGGRSLAVLHLDLDRFKVINESLGHEIADQLLKETARRLLKELPDADTVARLSGDEFVVLLDNYGSLSNLIRLGSRLLQVIGKPTQIADHELVVAASIGAALMPDNASDETTLLRQANTAMHHAKHLGGNTLQFYTERLRVGGPDALRLETQLRRALEENQLEVFYQPRLRLPDRRLEGAEALVRWRHPERGLLAPGQFVPLAEDTGLIVPLGEQVLRQACAQARRWQLDGKGELRVSVNLSVKQLRQGNLVSLVRQTLEDSGLAPHLLELELTESLLLDDVDNAISVCRQLRALGVSLAIDDFGTGYSSLSYLKRFPMDYVKIDRSFIAELDQSDEDAAIVRAIIAMAHTLDLKVVAEGVETEAQCDFLRGQRCDEVQGYLFSPPIEPAQFDQLFR